MANAAPAYRQSARAAARSTRVSVVRSTRRDPGLSRTTLVVSRVFVAVVLLFAIVGCVRVGLTAATVNTAIATEELTSQVNDLQSAGSNLEVQESSLTNPAYVRSVAANELGMSAPKNIDTIALAGDVVAYDEAGNLSLSLSLAQAAQG